MIETVKSPRRSKPGYVYSIIGVSLVLLIMGIMGWFFLNIRQMSNTFKEDIRFSAYLRTQNKDTIAQIQRFIAAQPFAKDVQYINKESAKAIWNKDNNEDWSNVLADNPLPESIDFYTKATYVNADSLHKISNTIMRAYGDQVTDLQYPKMLVNNINQRASQLGVIFLVVSILLCVIVIVSIDNTIRLAMFSNRFLIKTMQMVGATRSFISRPMTARAVVNGLISIALIQWAESEFPQLKLIQNLEFTLLLFGGMAIVGVAISVYSTHRSVIKYLKTKLDDLY
jgi:cell division transport system permease protein